MTRFPPIADEAMTPAQRAVAAEIAAGPRGSVRGPFLALLHNPELAQRVQALGEYLRFRTGFAKPLTEIAVLVTARKWTCQYEWLAHEALARKAGVSSAIIDAISERRVPSGMSPDEEVVYTFCSQVNERGEPDDTTFKVAAEKFGRDGALNLIALCGYYSLLAMVLNTAKLPLPNDAPPPLR